jgi:hypothetical protein
MNSDQTMIAVLNKLKRLDILARYEYPGYIAVPTNGASEFHIGPANGRWAWNQVDHNGDEFESGEWTIAGDSQDVDAIVEEIVILIKLSAEVNQ